MPRGITLSVQMKQLIISKYQANIKQTTIGQQLNLNRLIVSKTLKSSGGSRGASDSKSLDNEVKPRSTHQVHPVLDARHLVGYEKIDRSDTPSPPLPQQKCLPLAPNICVEAGRIQFMRQEDECSNLPPLPTINGIASCGRVTVTRGLQTDVDDFLNVQSVLEKRIVELELALEASQKNELRDKQTVNKLTKQLNRFFTLLNKNGK
ncbi:hypothetical protein ABEB36_012896 [Hypothenemus hampei]|uniref:Uncharacterized protein n=1 Tax=Hypothenemus hampei TaxID=57062 RepID=A0ABD1E879_HYPHA